MKRYFEKIEKEKTPIPLWFDAVQMRKINTSMKRRKRTNRTKYLKEMIFSSRYVK